MTGAAAADPEQPDAWRGGLPGWHTLHGLVLLAVLLRFAVGSDLTAGTRVLGAALCAAMAVAFLALRPPYGGGRTLRGSAYLALAVVAGSVLCGLDGAAGLLLFVLYSQIWMLCTGAAIRDALFWSVLLATGSATGFATLAGGGAGAWTGLLLIAAVGAATSSLLGVWISRIIAQSRDRAELIAQLQAAREQLAQAHHEHGVLAERERVAREIHDTLTQGFTSVIMLAQAARDGDPDPRARLDEIEDVARENLAEARALVAAFAPVGLQQSSLTEALQRLADRFGAQTGLQVRLNVEGDPAVLDRDQEIVLLRTAQESLTNARRHSGAARVQVRLVVGPGEARIEVDDDGTGIAPDAGGAGFGLSGIRDRVEAVGGSVEVGDAPVRGTRVSVRLPLAAAG